MMSRNGGGGLNIIDGHCDVIWKLAVNQGLDWHSSDSFHVTYDSMRQYQSFVQNFAIFIEPSNKSTHSMDHIRTNVTLFHEKIRLAKNIQFITTASDLKDVIEQHGIGGLLSLEGCDCIEQPERDIGELFKAGIRIISLTWNPSNWTGDGALGSMHGGLTKAGKTVIKSCVEIGMILDVSHLSDASFEQLFASGAKKVVATHSNCRTLCNHPRNLTDFQIQTLIQQKGIIGLNFVPMFVCKESPNIFTFLKHFEHVCELGGAKHVALGSDFDGIDHTLIDVQNLTQLHNLIHNMQKLYREDVIHDFLCNNWYHYLMKNLP